MRAQISKIALAALMALGLSAALPLTTPAQAAHFHGGGGGGHWGGGGGHWHGGYGGWRGGGWGFGLYAPYPYYGYGYGYGPYDDGCYAYRPIYDRRGRYLGRRLVNICY